MSQPGCVAVTVSVTVFRKRLKASGSLLYGVYARGNKISHTGGKCVTCSGLTTLKTSVPWQVDRGHLMEEESAQNCSAYWDELSMSGSIKLNCDVFALAVAEIEPSYRYMQVVLVSYIVRIVRLAYSLHILCN